MHQDYDEELEVCWCEPSKDTKLQVKMLMSRYIQRQKSVWFTLFWWLSQPPKIQQVGPLILISIFIVLRNIPSQHSHPHEPL